MVRALFVRARSHYVGLLGAESCWDVVRDALTAPDGEPVVVHPPCRAWGQLRGMAKPRQGERDLAIWAMWKVRRCGGVLEHPRGSALWREFGLSWGVRDQWGGVLVSVCQSDWGHRAEKATGLYVVRARSWPEPPMPRESVRTVEQMGRAERERTPLEFAKWMVDLAGRCE